MPTQYLYCAADQKGAWMSTHAPSVCWSQVVCVGVRIRWLVFKLRQLLGGKAWQGHAFFRYAVRFLIFAKACGALKWRGAEGQQG